MLTFLLAYVASTEAAIAKLERAALNNPHMAAHYRGVARRLAKELAEMRANGAAQGIAL